MIKKEFYDRLLIWKFIQEIEKDICVSILSALFSIVVMKLILNRIES